jgi:hypothetical protein
MATLTLTNTAETLAGPWLEGLGPTAEAVAESLRQRGIRGVPRTVRSLNPLVRYLNTMLPGAFLSLDVIQGDRLTTTGTDWREEEIPLPTAVQEFLAAFDAGDYPDLIRLKKSG